MPSETGWWTKEEAIGNHDFSYQLAKYIGQILKKKEPVADFGCGPGEYLRYLHDIGYENLLGLEGEPLDNAEFGNIKKQDLTEAFKLSKPSHIICLEVGEHIPDIHLATFLDNIANNMGFGCLLIYSHAIPNQDGYGHVSCRQNIWVINELQKRGLTFLPELSIEARSRIENRFEYFKNTIMIFRKS